MRPLPLALVDDAQLGCPADAHVEGDPIDVTTLFATFVTRPAALAALNDGGVAMLAGGVGREVSAVRLDAKLREVARTPIGEVRLVVGPFNPRTHVAGSRGLFSVDSTEDGTNRHFASFVAADLLNPATTSIVLVEGPSFQDGAIRSGLLTGDGKDATAWIKTLGADEKVAVFRHTLADQDWQKTGLEDAPISQWTESGKLNVEIAGNAVVVALDGSVESTTPIRQLARSTELCDYPRLQRTPYGFVTVRQITARVPCGQAVAPQPPIEWWLHFPADGPGRKVAEHPSTQGGTPVDIELAAHAASVAVVEADGDARYTVRIQRLDARLENVGKELSVSLDGAPRSATRNLFAVLGGYWLLIRDAPTLPGPSRARAYRVICG